VSTAAIVPFAAFSLLALAAADGRLPRTYAVVKPLATATLLLALAPYAESPLRIGTGVGLAFATLGDALLVHKADRRYFYGGMAAFALAHATYATTLLTTTGGGAWPGIAAAFMLAGGLTALVQSRLAKRLSRELVLPVAAYAVVITGTIVGASGWATSDAGWETRAMILAGALLLYLGDAFYAFNLFVSRQRYGQSLGLVLYFGGQLALVLGVRSA
jgi:uncharacterized membrane protein YhhN